MRRHPRNPILTRADIPDVPPLLHDVTSVFNPGAVERVDTTARLITLLLRVQDRSRETYIVPAHSQDGISFEVAPRIVEFKGLEKLGKRVYHIYDARITRLDGAYYILFAMDMDDGCQLGLGRTADFREFEFLGRVSDEDIRNGVLFPEKIGGSYLRLDRPNKARHVDGPTSGSTIWLSESDDLLTWRPVAPLIDGRFHYWDEFIGSGPPPVKTRQGWLHIYHGVAGHFGSSNIYQAGAVLLDLRDPTKVLGRCRRNILEPREIYELAGQVPNVVFPSGMIVETIDRDGFAEPGSPVRVYYGAADTCVGLAETTIAELLAACAESEIGVRLPFPSDFRTT
ncbi:MAG: glycoside hydrolase family 130 protein [Acidobacteriota bacterium]|nr:glycoside hydrolase family 130 protein [Acidobacteriota bacterium]